MHLTLAVDCGTTNLKAGVLTPSGNVLSYSTSPIELHSPEKNAAEHSAEVLWDGFKTAVREASSEYSEDIGVLGLSGYQFGFMPLDADYAPLTGMLTLLDGRSRAAMTSLTEGLDEDRFYNTTGMPPMFTSLLAKIAWLRDFKPSIYEQTAHYADIKSFLIHRLTGHFVTEPSIAATTQMLDFASMQWNEALLDKVGVSVDQMPEVRSGDEILCELPRETTETLNLEPGTQLLPGLYDGGAMMIGMGALTDQKAVCSIGTSTMLRVCVGEPVLDDPATRRLQTYPLFEGTWATGGGINNGGIVLQWFKDCLLDEESYDEILCDAKRVSPGAEGLMCLPYLSGERDPRIGENASGMFVGIRPQHGSGHFTRAILEGVACTVNLINEATEDNDIGIQEIRICGSGSQSDLWCQIFADICAVPVCRSIEKDATLIGTGMLAAAATGIFEDLQEAKTNMVYDGDTFNPASENREIYDALFDCYERLLPDTLKIYNTHNSSLSHIQREEG